MLRLSGRFTVCDNLSRSCDEQLPYEHLTYDLIGVHYLHTVRLTPDQQRERGQSIRQIIDALVAQRIKWS